MIAVKKRMFAAGRWRRRRERDEAMAMARIDAILADVMADRMDVWEAVARIRVVVREVRA